MKTNSETIHRGEAELPTTFDTRKTKIHQQISNSQKTDFDKNTSQNKNCLGNYTFVTSPRKIPGGMVETRSPKSSEGQQAMLEVEVHLDPAMDENQEAHGPEVSGNRRLASESAPVEQGQDFATSTETLDREEMSELSDISTENVATTRSPTDNIIL